MRLLIVRNPADTRQTIRRGEPVTAGLPLAAGQVRGSSAWSIVDDDGRAEPVQTRTLETWADGSIRWLLVDAKVDVPAGAGRVFDLVPRESARTTPAITSDIGPEVSIRTGAASFVLTPGSASLFTSVETAGRPVLAAQGMPLEITDGAGRAHRPRIASVDVIDHGSLRTRISVRFLPLSGPLADLAIVADLDFFAGLPTVRISVRARNVRAAEHPGNFWDLGDPGSLLLQDLSLAITPTDQSSATVMASLDSEAPAVRFGAPFEIYQDSSGGENWQSTNHINRERRVPTSFRGYRVRAPHAELTGLRATPIVQLSAGASVITAAVPQFWQNFPRAIAATEQGLRVAFFPSQYSDLYELQGGEQKTHVCVISFGDDTVTEVPLDWCRSPLVARLEPSAYLDAPAVGGLGGNLPGQAALIEAAIDGDDTFDHKREVVDEYGWRHFGEIYGDHEAIRHKGPMPLVSHYNNQYDPIAGFLYQFFRTGDARWWRHADELASHVIDIDVYHTTRDKWAYNHGLFWHTYHYGDADTCTHRTYPRRGQTHGGGPSADHTYTTGLMLHYFLTGNESSRETVAEMAQFIVDADDGSKTVLKWLSRAPTGYASASGTYAYHGPGRAPANAVNTLMDGHRLTGNPGFLSKAEEIIRRVVHPTENIDALRLDDPENKWFYLMFLQSLGRYLWRKIEIGQIDAMYAYGRAVLLHYGRWMADHEYPYLERPERLTFPTETWAAHEMRKSDAFCFAAMHSDGVERERFLERARFFHDYALRALADKPTRTLARPVVVLLSSGLILPWLNSGAGPALQLPPAPPVPFGAKPVFQTQRQIAKRRVMILLVAGGLAFVGAMTVLAWHLMR